MEMAQTAGAPRWRAHRVGGRWASSRAPPAAASAASPRPRARRCARTPARAGTARAREAWAWALVLVLVLVLAGADSPTAPRADARSGCSRADLEALEEFERIVLGLGLVAGAAAVHLPALLLRLVLPQAHPCPVDPERTPSRPPHRQPHRQPRRPPRRPPRPMVCGREFGRRGPTFGRKRAGVDNKVEDRHLRGRVEPLPPAPAAPVSRTRDAPPPLSLRCVSVPREQRAGGGAEWVARGAGRGGRAGSRGRACCS